MEIIDSEVGNLEMMRQISSNWHPGRVWTLCYWNPQKIGRFWRFGNRCAKESSPPSPPINWTFLRQPVLYHHGCTNGAWTTTKMAQNDQLFFPSDDNHWEAMGHLRAVVPWFFRSVITGHHLTSQVEVARLLVGSCVYRRREAPAVSEQVCM